ncbi:DUF6249 domain-containing protein [uncultured Bacteroides sp.]|uniref:DUF6249 domain-containing protein n=1 Tax=uncultured Bacteroides sp. TaxID=162156 RepID=UPI002AA7E69D|nr:DUF6249 domain-containing protein [uncultured Bacteroides sp.]
MMDFIMAPLIVGIVTLGIYKLFELFVCKRERLAMIEKLSEKISGTLSFDKLSLPSYTQTHFSFGGLKAGCLLMGVGLGLLVGFLICINYFPYYGTGQGSSNWDIRQISGVVYGSCVMLFGGAGLIIAFIIEMQNGKKKKGGE